MSSKSPYQTYILRVWQVQRNEQSAVVASLDDCRTSQRQAFASLAELLVYLERVAQEQDEDITIESNNR
jgi:hypothetical protein